MIHTCCFSIRISHENCSVCSINFTKEVKRPIKIEYASSKKYIHNEKLLFKLFYLLYCQNIMCFSKFSHWLHKVSASYGLSPVCKIWLDCLLNVVNLLYIFISTPSQNSAKWAWRGKKTVPRIQRTRATAADKGGQWKSVKLGGRHSSSQGWVSQMPKVWKNGGQFLQHIPGRFGMTGAT